MNNLYTSFNSSEIQELEEIKQIKSFIVENKDFQLITSQGNSISIPEKITEILINIINIMAQGKSLSLIPLSDEINIEEAAQIINVSQSYLIKMIKNKDIPYHLVENRKKILLKDLLEYKIQRDQKRKEGLKKLTELTQELGLYDHLSTKINEQR